MPNLSAVFGTLAINFALGFAFSFSLLAIEASGTSALPMYTGVVLAHICGICLLFGIPSFSFALMLNRHW